MRTVLLDLPNDICGFVSESIEGYTIVLNARHTREKNRKTYEHEIEHIENGDFLEVAVGEIELLRHRNG